MALSVPQQLHKHLRNVLPKPCVDDVWLFRNVVVIRFWLFNLLAYKPPLLVTQPLNHR